MDSRKSLDEKIKIDNNLSNRYIDLDPNGYFIIKVDLEENKIILEHFLNNIDEEGYALDPETNEPIKCDSQNKRVSNEVFKGRYHEQPKVTSFPNDKNLDEIYTVGPISVRSACSHHLVPILGECWIGIKPGNKVIGLSKFARVADWVFSRPHIHEEAVMILADEIEKLCEPKGLGIIVKAQHYCMKWRGVKEPNTSMINSVVRGDFRHDLSLKQEFFELVKQQSATNNY